MGLIYGKDIHKIKKYFKFLNRKIIKKEVFLNYRIYLFQFNLEELIMFF